MVISAVPLHVALGSDEISERALHHHGDGIRFPGAAQEGLRLEPLRPQILVGDDVAVVDDEAVAGFGELPAVGGDGVHLVGQRPPHDDLAVLDHAVPLPEDEVDGAVDAAVPVELPRSLVV